MGTYSDPALILPGAVGQTELATDAKRDVAGGVCALGASKQPLIYTNDHSSQMKLVDAATPTKGASITSFEDPTYVGTDYCSNAYFDGTNWIKYDATKTALSLYHDAANNRTSLWRSAVNEAQGQPIANWVEHTILEADVANGIVKLDNSGDVISPSSGLKLTRDGSNDIAIFERTSNEQAIALRRIGANDYLFRVFDSGSAYEIQNESMKNIASGIAGLDIDIRLSLTQGGVPAGVILPYGAAAAPAGYLLCDGSAVSRTTYAYLFAVVGTTYGVGDGSTTFNVPNMQGNVPVGIGGSGVTNLADTGGEQTHTLIVSEIPAHTHTQSVDNSGVNGISRVYGTDAAESGSLTSSSTGGDGAHQNMQPYVGVNYIIHI